MLFAVEGGGFFSSSASGYSKGFMLLILGRKTEERPTRLSPWNHYQLVNPEPQPDLHLASRKSRTSHGCASFLCFRSDSASHDCSSSKGNTQPDMSTVQCEIANLGDDDNRKEACLKSSLKKPMATEVDIGKCSECIDEVEDEMERRKVHWVDASGGELFEMKEFEVSSYGASEDGLEDKLNRGCGCAIQ